VTRLHRLLALLVPLALGLVACESTPPPLPPAEPLHLVVLHTNDVHGQVLSRPATWVDRDAPPDAGGLPRLAAEAARVRAEVTAAGGHVLLVDAGDWFQGTPEGLVDAGLGFVSAMADVGYDALCIGNHEFDHGVEALRSMLEQVELPHVGANLLVAEGAGRVGWTKPYRVVERGGLRIALVGLVTPVTPAISHVSARSIVFEDPVTTLRRMLPGLRDQSDLVIPLTHLGIEEDRRLARELPELPLIVGGHSHTYLNEGIAEGDTLIVQAGNKATVLGRVDLWVDRETGDVVRTTAELLPLLEEPAVPNVAVAEACATLVERSAAAMEVQVGELTAPLQRGHGFESSPAGNFVTDCMRTRVGADVALQNRGGIRADLQAGPVTRRDLFGMLPFGNTLVVLELTGDSLHETVRRAVEGKVHSGMEFSGMTVLVDTSDATQARLVEVSVGGVPLEPHRTYRVATNSFLVGGGDGYLDIDDETPALDTGFVLRDVVAEVLAASPRVTPPAEDRYRVAEPVEEVR
jgi:5'-nucleotidase